MQYPFQLPHTIRNPMGEELTFQRLVEEGGEQKFLLTNRVQPGAGPPFHVHYKQDESLTVIKGLLGYQLEGEAEKFLQPGEQVVFARGKMHRFWNAGEGILECEGWIKPANTIDYYLTGIYQSMTKAGKPEGDPFDSAYLITRYRSEYDLKDIPPFVKQVIFPITVWIGHLLGKYKSFKNSPKPLK